MRESAEGPQKGGLGKRRWIAGVLVLAAVGWRMSPSIDRETQFWLARRAIADGRLEDARAPLELMIRREPIRTRARLLLVEVLRRQGEITEAEFVLQRTVELGLPVEEARREFALLYSWEDFPRAEKSLRRLLEAHPEDREVRQALAEGRSRADGHTASRR